MNSFCILFADSFKNYDVGGLAKGRTLASLPVGCRYRLVDFMLSSLVKAGVPNIGILTTTNYNSLMDHLGWGKDWNLNRKNSGLKILPPMASVGSIFPRNKFEALYNAEQYIGKMLQDYCILADSNIVANIDFEDVMKFHQDNNADITILTVSRKPEPGEIEMIVDHKNRAYDSLYHQHGADYECNTMLKTIIMHKDLLKTLIKRGTTLGWEDMARDYISKNFNKLNVYTYKVEGYSKVVTDPESFYALNMDLLEEDVHSELFLSGTEIMTRVKDSVPTMYGKNAQISNSIFADGSHIYGKVENSVIFRDVLIEEGAEVKNCVLMNGTVVKAGASLSHVITDKLVTVNENKELKGDENCQFIVPKLKNI